MSEKDIELLREEVEGLHHEVLKKIDQVYEGVTGRLFTTMGFLKKVELEQSCARDFVRHKLDDLERQVKDCEFGINHIDQYQRNQFKTLKTLLVINAVLMIGVISTSL